MALGVIHQHVEHLRIEDDVVGGAEDVFHLVHQEAQPQARRAGVTLFLRMRQQVDLREFLPHHVLGAVGGGVVGNHHGDRRIMNLPHGLQSLAQRSLEVVVDDDHANRRSG